MSRAPDPELGYVLKSLPFRERDLILSVFSETRGRFSALARNAIQSRRFGGSTDLFTCSELEIDPRSVRLPESGEESLLGLKSATVRHSPKTLSTSFLKLSAASCLNELLIRMMPVQKPSGEVFRLYSNTLLALDESEEGLALPLLNAFILKMTQWLGVQPALTRCLKCETPLHLVEGDSVRPEISLGAWICGSCDPGVGATRLSKTLILDAYHSMLHPIRKIVFVASPDEHGALIDFLEQHLQYFVPGFDRERLSSIRFLKSPGSLP